MNVIITRPSPAVPGSVAELILDPSTPADQQVLNQLQHYETRGVGIDPDSGDVTYVRLELKET